ncbi:flavin-containing monooxygenase [Nocardioides aequoreus]|uniref:flavin-containing monooxygenase n=1 Tax=Nocardioides aequoreus TaxID=397278 RepID=UPI0004C3AF22|nr:NAD(P)/FAD-dependent oxidoreductase [Nocardioides aequoreus]
MTAVTAPALPAHVHTVVVGAGFSGLGAAIRLDEEGEPDYLVVERGETVGGTWRVNTYPGAACDVPSQLYSFSFAPNPSWSRSYSPQPEILRYLEDLAERSGVLNRFRFGTEVESITWEDADQAWRVVTSRGSLTADVVVSAAGGITEPRMPDIEGLEDFAGPVVHTARWDHDQQYAGRRVAVIGTGASAIQVVPELAEVASHLDVYQRTPPWIIPRGDHAYHRLHQLAFRHVPGLQRLARLGVYLSQESVAPIFTVAPGTARPAEEFCRRFIRRSVGDTDLAELLTPDYRIGCKRVLRSNDYYPALTRPHVDLVTDGIERVTPTGIVTRSGEHREIDVLVVATGFDVVHPPVADLIKGRDGSTLADTWRDGGLAAYKGTTIAGFPNLFMVFGPNTGLGHNSMIYMFESQLAYILSALRHLRTTDVAAVEPRQEAQDRFNRRLHRRMRRTVWTTGGCASWYLDEQGRNTTLWPRSTLAFRRALKEFDPAAYDETPRRTTQEEAA